MSKKDGNQTLQKPNLESLDAKIAIQSEFEELNGLINEQLTELQKNIGDSVSHQILTNLKDVDLNAPSQNPDDEDPPLSMSAFTDLLNSATDPFSEIQEPKTDSQSLDIDLIHSGINLIQEKSTEIKRIADSDLMVAEAKKKEYEISQRTENEMKS